MIQNYLKKSDSGGWCCSQCDYGNGNRGDVANHIEARHVDSSVNCDICGIETKTRKSLKVHKFRHHKDML